MSDLIQLIADGVATLTQGWLFKVLAAIVIAFIGPMQDGYLALTILMLLDLFLGIVKAAKEGELSGRRARYKTVIKLMVYWFVIAASYQLTVIINDEYPLKIAIFYLGASEFLSVYRNGMAVLGRPPLPKSLIDDLSKRIEAGEEKED